MSLLKITLIGLLVFHGVRPHKIAKYSRERNLLETVYLIQVLDIVEAHELG